MSAILVEPKAERKPGAACFGKSAREAKAALFGKMEEGKIAAERFVKHGRYAVEDAVAEAAHAVKREPFKSLAFAFAAGAFLGFIMPKFGRRS